MRNTRFSEVRCGPRPARRQARRSILEILEHRELLSVWTVNSTTDTGVGTGSSGDLRYCITQANADSTTPTIDFALGGSGAQTISLSSPLPPLTQPVTIDGTSQSNYAGTPLVVLDGTALTANETALTVAGGNSTIKALAIENCPGTGMALTTNGSDVVVGCFLGTSAAGTAAAANGVGISISGSSNNTIGGTGAFAGNLISGNSQDGVSIGGTTSSDDNVLMGNLIGTDITGKNALGNKLDGILINNGAGNTIGGTATGAGNVISGNLQAGIEATSAGASNEVIQGNLIGTNKLPVGQGVSLSTGFNGLQFTDTQGWVPPSPTVAVGQSHVMETVSNTLRVFDKSGNIISTTNLSDFFPNSVANNILYPQVFYDDAAQRFVVSALEDTQGSSTSYLDIAFSDAGNETSFSAKYRLNVQQNGDFATSPTFGFNADAIVYSFDMYSASGTSYGGVQILSIDPRSIGSASLTTVTLSRPNDFSDAPASMHGSVPGDPMYFVESDNQFSGTYTDIHVLTWATPLSATSSFTDTQLTVATYKDPTAASQQGSPNTIYTGYINILNVAWRNNSLVAAQGIDNSSGVPSARWYEITTNASNPQSLPTLAQSGTIAPSNGAATYYPSIDIDPSGNLGMTFMESSSSEYMSMYVTGQVVGAAPGTMLAPVLVQAGLTTYTSYDTPPYLAGFYSGTTVDPVDGSFWSANEYANGTPSSGNANWGTWIQHFTLRVSSGFVYAVLGNGTSGVLISGSANDLIGGSVAAAANIIGGNGGSGIQITASSAVAVQGNDIGTDPNGDSTLGNTADGITVTSSNDVTIGGSISGMGNLISGNTGNGIQLNTNTQLNSDNTLIQGNLIGLNPTGSIALGNGGNGIFQNGADNTTIGGTTSGARNVIDGSTGFVKAGISVGTGNYSLIEGNFIGTDITGTVPLGNYIGLLWSNGSYTTVGGTTAAARNIISGNSNGGIDSFVLGSGNELIEGNYIGVDVTGITPMPNGRWGIRIAGPTNNTIGGTVQGAGNVISANTGVGIVFSDNDDQGTVVEGNFIGTDATGTLNLGNTGTGIVVGSSQVTIGGTVQGAGNIIANNLSAFGSNGDGVAVSTNGDAILSNSIYNNAGLGINFGNGPTPNHGWPPGVAPGSGPNNYQNYPVLTSAIVIGSNITIKGTLNAAPNTQFLVQFFASPSADPSGYGQGQFYLGSATVTTDSTSNATFNVTLPASVVSNGYAISATATDPNGNTSEFSKDAQSTVVADVSITGQVSPTTVHVGDTMTYTFTVSNNGPDDAQGTQFSDTLPTGLTYAGGFTSVPAGITPTVNGQSITASLGTVSVAAQVQLSFQVQVQPGAVPSVTNTGSVSTTASDPDTSNNSFSVTTTVQATADLAVSAITTSPTGPNYVGVPLSYTITVFNNGPSPATGVTVTDPLPANTTFQSASGGVTPDSNGNLIFSVGNLASLSSATESFTVIPSVAAGGTNLSNTASVTSGAYDPHTANDTLTVATSILPSADLQVGISPSVSPVLAGQNEIYTITATNNGLSDATNVVVTDTIPSDVTFVSASGGATPDATGKITFNVVPSLAANTSASFQVTVTTTGTTATPTTDLATIAGDQHDSNMANNSASISVPVTPVSNLGVSVSASPDPVHVGDTLAYTITATNNGPSAEPGTVVTDTLDPNVSYISATSSVVGAIISFDNTTGVVTANLGTLAANPASPATVTVNVSPLPSAAVPLQGTVSNTASVSGQNYPNTVPTQTISTTVNALADLAITSLQATSKPLAGQPLVFTIKAVNNGPSDATNVVLTDDLPSTQNWTSFSATTSVGVTPNLSGTTVTANIPALASGATVTMTITVIPTVAAVGNSPLSDTAQITGDQDDTVDNNTKTITFSVTPAVDLAITQFTASPSTVQIGDHLTYTIVVINHGPSPATVVTVTSPLAAGESYVTGSGSVVPSGTGTVALQGSSVVTTLPTLASGASATITYTVVPSLIETLNASTSVTATETNTDTSSNSATTSTMVVDRVGTIEFSAAGYSVDENAGTATLTVSRIDGARGTITVDYTTVPINATPGLDYTPVSGTLTFPDGVTTETIKVLVLDNPYDHENELLNVVLSHVQSDQTLGQALLGTPGTATLTIVDIDPDYNPLVVTGVQWTGTTQNITQIFVTFSRPLISSTALNPANWSLINVGADGKYGTLDDSAVSISESFYASSSLIVALTPSQPLPTNQFFHLWINGATPGGVEDVGRNMLAGDGSDPGTAFTAMLARGTNLKYYTPAGDQVNLKITGGGIIDDLLNGNGQGVKFTVVGEVPHHTVLSGNVHKVRGGTGKAYLGYTVWGLGTFGDVRVKMYSPPFQVGLYPFSPGSSATTSVKSLAAIIEAQARSSRTRARSTRPAARQSSTSTARPMSRPFHAFHR